LLAKHRQRSSRLRCSLSALVIGSLVTAQPLSARTNALGQPLAANASFRLPAVVITDNLFATTTFIIELTPYSVVLLLLALLLTLVMQRLFNG
jgi:hypothetical protein